MAEFVDRAQFHARGGNGGAGSVSFRREAHVDKGGPDGGDGGNGGSVYLRASSGLSSLITFRDYPFRKADDGLHGHGKKKTGPTGRDVFVDVPQGTVVRSQDGEPLADLYLPGMTWLAARGGRGGKGNARFLSNRRRAPAFAEQGEAGEEFWFSLELKLMADVALVGMPNAGKSSLIAAVSKARPKIANYPFTTLIPTLGVVQLGRGIDTTDFVVADIPGLIEGASTGKGLGFEFLRHIERAKVIALVLDLSQSDDVSPIDQYRALLLELGNYMPELLQRPRILVGSKADLYDRDTLESWTAEPGSMLADLGLQLDFIVSSVTRQGLREVVAGMAQALSEIERSDSLELGEVDIVLSPDEGPVFEIQRVAAHRFEVLGRDAVRAVRLSDLSSPEAVAIVSSRLARMGVIKSLRKHGARDGDDVSIGNFSFVFEEDLKAKR